MLEIEIAFIYFDESIKERTELLEKEIRTFKNNYLVYYIFCNNYCIFSNIEITKNEAKILVAFIEDDKGLDLLYGEGIKTDYATYRIYSDLNEENLNQEAIKESNSIFEEKLDKYLNNVKEAIDIKELQEKEKKLENINDKISEKDCTIEESKLLLEDYKKLVNEKNKKIQELTNSNNQLANYLNNIPRFIKKIFIKKYKLLSDDK